MGCMYMTWMLSLFIGQSGLNVSELHLRNASDLRVYNQQTVRLIGHR